MIRAKKIVQKCKIWDYLKTFFLPLLILLLSCGMSIYYLRLNPDHLLVFDDSYITLRFASNLFKYRGITYDGVSCLAGATSPLHIIFVALAGFFLKLETASLVVGIVFFVFSSILVYLWTLRIYEDRKIVLLAGVMMSTCGRLAMAGNSVCHPERQEGGMAFNNISWDIYSIDYPLFSSCSSLHRFPPAQHCIL